jgi:hypothetical protein
MGMNLYQKTVGIFSNSRVVVGFHGAGLVNTLFCRPETIALEYTTFHDIQAERMWRSNETVGFVHGSLKWLKHGIDIDPLTDMKLLNDVTETPISRL